MSNSEGIKKLAKEHLNCRWPEALCVTLMPIATFMAVYILLLLLSVFEFSLTIKIMSTLILYAFALLVIFPLILGVIRYFWKTVTSRENAAFADTFCYYSSRARYLRAIRFATVFFFKLVVNAILCFFPTIVIALLNAPWLFSFVGSAPPVWAAGLTYITAYLEFFGWIIFLLISFKLYLAPVLIVIDSRMLSLEALHVSVMIHKRSFGRFVSFIFRNIDLVLFSLLGITLVYTLPLFIECYIIHTKNEIDNFNKSLEMPQTNTFVAFGE